MQNIKIVTVDFGVSHYTMRKGGALQKTCDILPEVEKKIDCTLSHAVIVFQFYENDEYSCLHPGKDFMSVEKQFEETTQ
jgi:hypothetical protein